MSISCSKGDNKEQLKQKLMAKLERFNPSLFTITEFAKRGSYTYESNGQNLLLYFKAQLKLNSDYKFNNWDQLGTGSLISLLGSTPAGVKGINPKGNKAGDILTVYGTNNYIDNNGNWIESNSLIINNVNNNEEDKFLSDIEAEDKLDQKSMPLHKKQIKQISELSKQMLKNPRNLNIFQAEIKKAIIQGEILADLDKSFEGIATSNYGGEYYQYGKVIQKTLGKDYKSYETFGSLHNIELVKSGKVKFGIAQGDLLVKEFNKKDERSAIRGVMSLFPEAIQIITLKTSAINSFLDLNGKKVNIGLPKSGSNSSARQLLKNFPSTELIEKDIHMALEDLKNRKNDAVIFVGAYPFSPVFKFSTQMDIRLIPPTKEVVGIKMRIPKNTYQGQAKDYYTLGTTAVLFTSKETSNNNVSTLLKHLFENQSLLSQRFSRASEFSKENWRVGIDFAVHDGALNYFE